MQVRPELIHSLNDLAENKKLYFASDFHLGIPNKEESLKREKKIIEWLEYISNDASAIFLVGDVFDFWFEYKTVVPKSFVRFQAKLASLVDQGIDIFLFTGNHDMWMIDYLHQELGVKILHEATSFNISGKQFFVGHGDGLGPGDTLFKIIKKIFKSPIFRWMFRWLHPDIGVRIAQLWSRRSRIANGELDEKFEGDKERLWQFCKSQNTKMHHDYYIFGHRHLPLELDVSEKSTYFNLGEWVSQYHYLEFDGKNASLKVFDS